jgi:hypothetical protein
MPRPQEVRPGTKVPRSGIYQDSLSQRRATLVKGEPAPPTPHKASRWQQVADTASAPTHRGLPWPLLSGMVFGAGSCCGCGRPSCGTSHTRPGRTSPRAGWAAAWCWPSAPAWCPANV